MLDESRMRSTAWNNALHCHGTYKIFSRRLRRLKLMTKVRDFWGFAIPIILGLIVGSDVLALPTGIQQYFKVALGAATLIQILLALWAVFSRWDDGLAYSARAVRDAHEMEQAWAAIGQGRVGDIPAEFSMRAKQQDVIDSHDIGQEITDQERNIGMRQGLIEYRRECVECGAKPSTRNIPWRPKVKCIVCGGN